MSDIEELGIDDEFDVSDIVSDISKAQPAKGKGKKEPAGEGNPTKKIPEKELKRAFTKESPEDIAKREELLTLILRYGESPRFGKYLETRGFEFEAKKIRKMSLSELSDYLKRIESSINGKNSCTVVGTVLKFGTQTIENITQAPLVKPKLDLAGLTKALELNQDYLDAVEQLNLRYGLSLKMDPHTRVLFAIFTVGAETAAQNKNMNSMLASVPQSQQPVQQPVQSNIPANNPGLGLGGEASRDDGKKEEIDEEAEKLKQMGFG